ncbi:LLM class flavin-dependent oxidoreductase [Georgenia yuyongxinii]|uniref:LLM class flavin-dependent oxidoreductase n=1 Tax=Georgenia yuyongxinii TaxID=2589797 RepID=A0A5B8C697_9MICO|nr:LLM class flavin-dependent oxidoreductase [Georgenia yuyongxinii]QDC24911.1 LLM class flavin-dependent oxidoreductase [Georgenia yuyongxinii]
MSDYGHTVHLGIFPTPTSREPARVVRLARLAEEVGLDLVAIQDHPYQPAFLDTWTLLSYLGAVTERIHLAPDVANLPLRPPAVLARAVASLDLLTNGRVALGLGSGAFWDAVVAMGGPRRQPGEAVEALEQAIDVIRELWDPTRRHVRAGGDVYAVDGAKAGPAPAHDVPIWVGAARPRMLRLTGRLADGWLPSASWMRPEGLAAANAVIDEAARAAGRSPAAVRRLYNVDGSFGAGTGFLEGPAEAWVEQLAELAVTEGMGTFILAADDEEKVRRWGEEVARGVRERVAARRGMTDPTGPRPPDRGRIGA